MTLIAPLFIADELTAFVANRAHYADIGADSTGSMPISTNLHEEGQIIGLVHLIQDGMLDQDLLKNLVTLSVTQGTIDVDFTGSAPQVSGNINAPFSVAAAAVYYVFRCLMPSYTPACAGTFRPVSLHAPKGSLLNARYPAAVAAGNVGTSTRLVDVVMGALAKALPAQIPAASHGSMNNIAMGGGMGAGAQYNGLSELQTHMTNTLNTPIEALESRFPLRINRYQLRRESGGDEQHRGGDGLTREYPFLHPKR